MIGTVTFQPRHHSPVSGSHGKLQGDIFTELHNSAGWLTNDLSRNDAKEADDEEEKIWKLHTEEINECSGFVVTEGPR